MDLYLKTRDMDMDALREEARPVAESRLKQSLLLFELAKAENIEVKSEDLQTETLRTMNSLASTMSEKEARQLSNESVINNLATSIMADMLTQRSLERLRKIASGQLEEEPEEELSTEASVEASDDEADTVEAQLETESATEEEPQDTDSAEDIESPEIEEDAYSQESEASEESE